MQVRVELPNVNNYVELSVQDQALDIDVESCSMTGLQTSTKRTTFRGRVLLDHSKKPVNIVTLYSTAHLAVVNQLTYSC
jgi:hypothetical protein